MNSLRNSKILKLTLTCLAIILNIIIYRISIEKIFIEEVILTSVVLFSFYQFSAYTFTKRYYWSYIIVAIGVLLISLSQCIGLGTFFIYGSSFTYGHALSILNTNTNEVASMLSTMLLWVLLFVLNICFQCFVIFCNKGLIKNSSLSIVVGMLWLLIPFGSLGHSIITRRTIENRISIVLRNSPLYNLRPITLAYNEYEEMKEIRSFVPDYSNINSSVDGIPTVVLVIGESSRRQNMSLYGYERNTTPYQQAEKDNMLLYNNMVSPAAITLLSVPMLLSNVKPESYLFNKSQLGNNVIQLANFLNYETYWLSTQEEGNMYVSTVSNLAKFSQSAKWFNGFDEVLLDHLSVILEKDEEKFVVMHINGSHSNACDKYPAKARYFVGNNPALDCYDNSIRYTDSVMNEVFEKLKNENAVVIYLSDHAEKFENDRFIHSDSKEGTEIPYYIWYGLKVPLSSRKVGVIDELSSLSLNYYNIAELFGVNSLAYPTASSIKYLKSDMSVIEYELLTP